VRFFLLIVALSVPFWLAGTMTEFQMLPGLPVSALMFVCPAAAAAILVYRESGLAGVTGLLKRSFDVGQTRAVVWYAPAFLLMPAIMVLSYLAICWIGEPTPPPNFSARAVLLLMLVFFVTALGEELGWSGYAIDPLQQRWGAVSAGIVVGLVSAVWHVVPLLQAHRSAKWIAWWGLWTVAGRVLIVWLYNNAGKSVFAAVIFHMMTNVTWQLFPVSGSYFDPRVTGLIEAFVAAAVAAAWGPRQLVRGKQSGRGGSPSGERSMVRHELLQSEGILIVSVESPLEAGDFRKVAQEIDAYTEANGRLVALMIDAESFPGHKDFAGLIAHLKFVKDYHRKVRRAATVGDSRFVKYAPMIIRALNRMDIQHFSYSRREDALRWLGEENR